MAFPSSLDNLSTTRGTNTNPLSAPNHVTHHTAEDTAIQALEAKVGIDGSAVTTTHDYKLSGVLSTDKAVSKTGAETLTNKTLTSPQLNFGSDTTGDILYRNPLGTTTRLPIGPTGYILDVSSAGIPEWVVNPAANDASTSTKGVVEEATLAETIARTGMGTVARLFVSPTNLTSIMLYDYITDTGTSTAYAIAPTVAVTALVTGQEFRFKAINANTTATPTLAVSGLTAKTIVRSDLSSLAIGDIAANSEITVRYNGTSMVAIAGLSGTIYKDGVTTKDISVDATQTIAHGLGRPPKKIRLTILNTTSGTEPPAIAHFAYNGTTAAGIYYYKASSAGNVGNGSTFRVGEGGNGTGYSTATVTIDATNISIAWVKTNTPTTTCQILWEAEV